jgi:hypothetical protein
MGIRIEEALEFGDGSHVGQREQRRDVAKCLAQQLWTWSASDGSVKPLTASSQDHSQPMCSPDGQQIFFVSDPYDSGRPVRNTTIKGIWSFDRRTRQEHEIWSASSLHLQLLGITKDGDLLFQKAGLYTNKNGKYVPAGIARLLLKKQGDVYKGEPSPLPIAEPARLVVSPDGAQGTMEIDSKAPDAGAPAGARPHVVFLSPTTDAYGPFFFSPGKAPIAYITTDKPRVPIAACETGALWSPDGTRIACSAGQDIVIVDVAAQRETERVRFSGRKDPTLDVIYSEPRAAAWSPDGKQLLARTYGRNSSSDAPQADYFLLDLTAKTWTPAMTGNDAMWLPGRQAIVYTTPIDLLPLPPSGEHRVWSTHLAMFDLATHKERLLTSGLTNNQQPTLCVP